MPSEKELLALQNQEEVKNTYYRYPTIVPKATLYQDHMELSNNEIIVSIGKLEECILYILSLYKYLPVWLIKQWCAYMRRDGYQIVEAFIKIGLVWAEPTAIGVFIRPTAWLFDIVDLDEKERSSYTEIPFNLLNHTCAEEQIMFDIMMGNPYSELWITLASNNNRLLPAYHPMKINPTPDSGAFIRGEDAIRVDVSKPDTILDKYVNFRESIKNKSGFTEEFKDWTLFNIVNYNKDNNVVTTQRPDLIVPMARIEGRPQSASIELELTAKADYKYDNIMNNYKDNPVYGELYYLCGNATIADKVRKAFMRAEGLGSCKLFLVPYTTPAQLVTTLVQEAEDEKAAEKMLELTMKNTKRGRPKKE